MTPSVTPPDSSEVILCVLSLCGYGERSLICHLVSRYISFTDDGPRPFICPVHQVGLCIPFSPSFGDFWVDFLFFNFQLTDFPSLVCGISGLASLLFDFPVLCF